MDVDRNARMKPILFNTDMVRAILDGRKTVTRRVVKCSHKSAAGFNIVKNSSGDVIGVIDYDDDERMYDDYTELPYRPGDILYVRETFSPKYYDRDIANYWNGGNRVVYKADWDALSQDTKDFCAKPKWKASIHMPKKAARLFLHVTGVRVERLREISEDDAVAEGAIGFEYQNEDGSPAGIIYPSEQFSEMWNSTIKPADRDRYGWDANPWVWVIQFEMCEKPKG